MRTQTAIMTIAAALLLMGCEGKSSGGGGAVDTAVPLVIGEAVTLTEGDRLVPLSDDARIQIVATPGATDKEVTLIQGSAKYYAAH